MKNVSTITQKKSRNYEKAKVNMVKHYLKTTYKYNENEINKINIMETKITIKKKYLYT